MKLRTKILSLSCILLMAGFLMECSEEDLQPEILYIRVTNPASSDSLLVAAGQGQMIAIMGRNLKGTKQVWFNDQKAVLTATLVTDRTIIVRVPSKIPGMVNNELKLIFDNDKTLIYDFAVDINEPFIDHVKCEYVDEGDEMVFYGNYYYEPITVTFTGGEAGVITSRTDEEMHVQVPVGAQPGPITLVSNFGEVETDFWFRDNRNILLSFENMTGSNGRGVNAGPLWHPAGTDFNYASSSVTNIPSINGNYLYNFFGASGYGAWGWSEIWTGNAPAPENLGLANIPEEAFADPRGYSLKFEANTSGSLAGAWFNIWIGNNIGAMSDRGPVGGQPNPKLYTWRPNFDTNGEWFTITIPWTEFYAYSSNGNFNYNPNGYDISIVLQGPNSAASKYLAIDNVRVVPNTND